MNLLFICLIALFIQALDLKKRKKKKEKRIKNQPDADVGSAKRASQSHLKYIII